MGSAHVFEVMRVAALDIGTNTALMLIAEGEGDRLKVIRDEHSIPRLGEDVDKTKRIGEQAIARLDEVLRRYRTIIDESGVEMVNAVGTSALRDASNSREVRKHIEQLFGVSVRLITGEEESRLTYMGAVSDLQAHANLTAVADIGGGSTEIALGCGREFAIGRSMDVGAVRLTESARDRREGEQIIRECLRKTFHLFPLPDSLVAVAGTATSVAAMKLGLKTFDREKISGTEVSIAEHEEFVNLLYELSAEELIARYPAIPKGRADILPAGALILFEALRYLRLQSVMVSTRGLRYGVAIDALRKSG